MKSDFSAAVMGTLPCGFPGAATAARLLTRSRRESTWLSYSGKLKRWIDYCTVVPVVPSRGFPAISPFPAQRQHVLAYLGYLRDEHRVKSGSLQQYHTSLLSIHGTLIWAWRSQLSAMSFSCSVVVLARSRLRMMRRRWLRGGPFKSPAPVMAGILHLAAQTAPSMLLRRAATASVLAYAFLLRADSLVRMLHCHVYFDIDGIFAYLEICLYLLPRWPDETTKFGRFF